MEMKTGPGKRALVVTTISPPNDVLNSLAMGCIRHGIRFVVAGDSKSPPDFAIDGCEYLGVDEQHRKFPEFSEAVPLQHYARKNLAYLVAMTGGCEWIQETDDDNMPLDTFWDPVETGIHVTQATCPRNWINVYEWFTSNRVWPRGFPLEMLASSWGTLQATGTRQTRGLIRQGLADSNPDVDAVFRLVHELPVHFDAKAPLMPQPGKWCPFNSQNTLFHRDVFPLLYLPSFCSFRMTDIWRSLVAQRCLHELGENTVFHSPTVVQYRNEHDILRDFEDEIVGYLHNASIARSLSMLDLAEMDLSGQQITCYRELVAMGLLPAQEITLLELWHNALREIL